MIQAAKGPAILSNIRRCADRVAFDGESVPEGMEVWPADCPDRHGLLTSARTLYTPEVLRAGVFHRETELDSVPLPPEVERLLEEELLTALKEAEPLGNRWVILLWDPDDSGWSPWPVIALSYEDAVRVAMAQWWQWITDPGPCHMDSEGYCTCAGCVKETLDPPEFLKAYRDSWIGERVDNKKG